MTGERGNRDNVVLARDVLAVTARVFPLEMLPEMLGGTMGGAAAWARCRALLEGMLAAIEAGAPEGTGALLRVMFEKCLVCAWLLSDPQEADRAISRSDFVFENRHRRKLGLPEREWDEARRATYGDVPTDDDELGTSELKKRAAAALRRTGGRDEFIHKGYRTIYGPESFASTHATIRSSNGHINEDRVVVTERSSDSEEDQDWRLPMAIGIVLSLAQGVYEAFGRDAAELDALAARLDASS